MFTPMMLSTPLIDVAERSLWQSVDLGSYDARVFVCAQAPSSDDAGTALANCT